MRDLDARAMTMPGQIDRDVELTYLRAGAEPPWERPHRNGVDVTSQPDLQTPYQRQRRESFEERVREYRASHLI
ncbi:MULTISPECIES: hypothetical protein [Microbacterium]|uniref:hypothetical protein n=1 Tax=Microbacterium TaxID=33882 RepID=UPI00039A5D43|nr:MULTISPECIES: hypothetical protein [Microbacterium]